jgi:hypothetical protein
MADLVTLAMIYVAVGVGLFAQPWPGTARPDDFTWQRQGEIFFETLPHVLGWPMMLWRVLR